MWVLEIVIGFVVMRVNNLLQLSSVLTYLNCSPISFLVWLAQKEIKNRHEKNHTRYYMENKYVGHSFIEKIITNFILSEMYGVGVLCLPPGTGKSTITREVCLKLDKKKKIKGYLYVRLSKSLIDKGDLLKWLCDYWNISYIYENKNGSTLELNSLLLSNVDNQIIPKPIVLILDTPSEIFDSDYIVSFQNSIVSMARNSMDYGGYKILLLMNDVNRVKDVLTWNDGIKIRSILSKDDVLKCKWGDANLKKLVKAYKFNDSNHIHKSFTRVGSAGFFLSCLATKIPFRELEVSNRENSWIILSENI